VIQIFIQNILANWQTIIKALSWQLTKSETYNKSRRSEIWARYNTTKCMDLPFLHETTFQRNRFHHTTSQLTSALRPRSVLLILAQQCVSLFSAICYNRYATLLTVQRQGCDSLVDKPRLTASQYIYILTFWQRSFTFNSNKSPTWCNKFFSLLFWRLFTAQYVSGAFPPIIRSPMTAVAVSCFTFVSWWQSCCVGGRAGYYRPDRSWWWAGKRPKHVEL
jgi:hypothetical protein